ncbi:hypothetical protein AQUCO_00400641v1 [Aquilegia coerulea]|uniref:Uncharacterized protein n=1 Tax=Aquilegia coerulea TaxID=218851 RepID=A0A2G5EW04_AQUCA|nr:hypothetical protein AQUCO_00400641v1 [Aquilegia coerulea]
MGFIHSWRQPNPTTNKPKSDVQAQYGSVNIFYPGLHRYSNTLFLKEVLFITTLTHSHYNKQEKKKKKKKTALEFRLTTTFIIIIMAHFTAQGGRGLNLLINGERLCFAYEFKDPFLSKASYNGGLSGSSSRNRKNKLRFNGCGKISSLGKKSNSFKADEDLRVDDDDDMGSYEFDYDDNEYGEFQKDELSCFRGLVLDISYRPINVVCWKRAICLEFMEKVC